MTLILLNVGPLILVYISLSMLENCDLLGMFTNLLFHVHTFNIELQYHVIDLLLANLNGFLFHLARYIDVAMAFTFACYAIFDSSKHELISLCIVILHLFCKYYLMHCVWMCNESNIMLDWSVGTPLTKLRCLCVA